MQHRGYRLVLIGMLISTFAPGCSTPVDPAASGSDPSPTAPAESVESQGDDVEGVGPTDPIPTDPAVGLGSVQFAFVGAMNLDAVLTDVPAGAVRFDFLDETDLTVTFAYGDVLVTLYLYGIPAGAMGPFTLTGDLAAEGALVFDLEYSDDQALFTAGADPLGTLTVTTWELTAANLTIAGTVTVAGQSLDAPDEANDTTATGTFTYTGPIGSE